LVRHPTPGIPLAPLPQGRKAGLAAEEKAGKGGACAGRRRGVDWRRMGS